MTKMEYSINLRKNITYSIYSGDLSAESFIEQTRQIRQDKLFTRGLNALIDLRNAIPTKGYIASATVCDYLKKHYFETGKTKTALVVQEVNHEIVELFLTIAKLAELPHVIKQFNTTEDAEHWLTSS